MTDTPSQAPDKVGVVERLRLATCFEHRPGMPLRSDDDKVLVSVADIRAALAALSPPPVVEEAGITRADREAAADLIEDYWSSDPDMRALAESYRAGHSGGVWADAFRRHRIAHRAPTPTAGEGAVKSDG